MLSSLKTLFSSPYNRQHPLFALRRFVLWKLIRIRKRRNVLYKLWGNRCIYLDYNSLQSMWIMYNYIVDWEEFNLIQKLVRQGDVVADVGANMGFYSVWMSKFTNQENCIHSFEPDPNTFLRLQKNIAVNKLQQVIIANNKGLGASETVVKFTSGLDGENHIATQHDSNTITISLTTLDNYCASVNISKIVYCKIDVEGFEADVLKGADTLLRDKKIGILQLEINRALQNSGYSAEDLVALIESYGYSLFAYDVNDNRLLPVTYTPERENYFAVADAAAVNARLQQNEGI